MFEDGFMNPGGYGSCHSPVASVKGLCFLTTRGAL